MPSYHLQYECDGCGYTWSTVDDYTCNDRCPQCRREIEPSTVEDFE